MTNILKRLGYGGSAVIDGVQVLVTSGSMAQSDSPSYLEMVDINPAGSPMASRSKVLHADGTSSYTGSIGFDVTKNGIDLISTSKLLGRGYKFNVGIHDGENQWVMNNCYLTSLSLSGSPGGFIASSISFTGMSGKASSNVTNNYILDDYYGVSSSTDNQPIGYWWSGGPDVKDWTFSMSQSVEAVYLNQNSKDPKYLRVGLIEYDLEVTLYESGTPGSISIRGTTFTITGVTTEKGYSYNGVSDLGTYSHSFSSSADMSSGASGIILV